MKNLSIDIETYSSIDLSKCGVYKYTEAEDFEILLFGYAVDGSEVQVVDLAQGEKIPAEIINALTNDSITKWAFNANFERVCLSVYLRKYYAPIFVWIEQNRKSLDSLKRLLGEVRKAEKSTEKRSYAAKTSILRETLGHNYDNDLRRVSDK